MEAEHKAILTEDCYIPGKLLDSTDCKILLNIGASKLYMAKTFYLNCLSLHSLSRTNNILVGNGQYIGVLLVIPVVINLNGHRYKAYTLVSDIYNNVDMVMGEIVSYRSIHYKGFMFTFS